MAEIHRSNFGTGIQSINEIRHEKGLNPLDDPMADEHFIPLNMIPLSQANAPKPDPQGGSQDAKQPGLPPVGDGETPADPTKEMEAKKQEAERLQAAEYLLGETLARMERIQANEALRASREAKTFINRLEVFFDKHREVMREAVSRPLALVALCGGHTTDLDTSSSPIIPAMPLTACCRRPSATLRSCPIRWL